MTALARVAAIGVVLRGLFPGAFGRTWGGLRSGKGDRLIAVQAAPAQWLEYAGRVAERVRAVLGDSAGAHTLWATRHGVSNTDAEARGESLRLKIWLEKHGSIEHVEVASPCEPAFEAALRAMLVATSVGVPPPRGMRQPIVMQLNVAVADSAGHM